jgi:hypothetical protein
MVPFELDASEKKDDGAMVAKGFHSIYKSRNPKTKHGERSAREQVDAELKRLVTHFRDEHGEEVRVTVTGHSLGGAPGRARRHRHLLRAARRERRVPRRPRVARCPGAARRRPRRRGPFSAQRAQGAGGRRRVLPVAGQGVGAGRPDAGVGVRARRRRARARPRRDPVPVPEARARPGEVPQPGYVPAPARWPGERRRRRVQGHAWWPRAPGIGAGQQDVQQYAARQAAHAGDGEAGGRRPASAG